MNHNTERSRKSRVRGAQNSSCILGAAYYLLQSRLRLMYIARRATGVIDPNHYACLRVRRGNYAYPIGTWGEVGYIAGVVGTMKTTLSGRMAAAGLAGHEVAGYEFDLGDRVILRFDGEQGQHKFERTNLDILAAAGKDKDNRLISYSLADVPDIKARRNELWRVIMTNKGNIGLIMIDGIANFINNPLDQRECNEFMNRILQTTMKEKCLTMNLNHITVGREQENKQYGVLGTVSDKLSAWGFRTEQAGMYYCLRTMKTREGAGSPPMYLQYKDRELKESFYFPY